MSIVDQESAVSKFFQLAGDCRNNLATAAESAALFADFFRNVRIADDEGEAILLQWGIGQSPLNYGFCDARKASSESIEFEDFETIFFSFTRQVFVSDGTNEFDDDAFHMFLGLSFGVAVGDEPSGCIEFWEIAELEQHMQDIATDPFLASLLHAKPSRYEATVFHCG